jgi:hypothetical protein
VPKSYDSPSGSYWAGLVESQGQTGNIQYSMNISMDGKVLTFDPFLKIS